jgi:hypothetical protein
MNAPIFATVFGGTLAADFAIFSAIIGMFGVILKMLIDQKTLQKTAAENRRAEVKSVIEEVMNARPAEINIQQPLRTVTEKELLTKQEHDTHCSHMERRVVALEGRTTLIERKMETDKNEMLGAGERRAKELHRRIDAVPSQVIALLKDTKGLI